MIYGGGQVLLHNERCSRDESAEDKSYMIRTSADMKIPPSSGFYLDTFTFENYLYKTIK